MIERLDIPNKSSFENDRDGVQPYYSKYSIPINLIKYANTVYTVKNQGLSAYWYKSLEDAQNEVSTIYPSTVPICKFYFAGGYPPVFSSKYKNIDWAVKYKFNFYAPYTGLYNFYFGGSGKMSNFHYDNNNRWLQVDESNASEFPNEGLLSFSDQNYWSVKNVDWDSNIEFQEKTWHSISFIYNANVLNNNEYGFIGMWQCFSDTSTPHINTPEKIPFSAGVCCPIDADTSNTNGETILTHSVNYFNSTIFSKSVDNFATFTFELPFIATGSPYNFNGYKHSSGGFVDNTNGIEIKKGRLIEYYEGYKIIKYDNYALNLSNVNYVGIPYDATLNCLNGLTLESWIKVENTTASGVIIGKPYNSVHEGDYFDYMMSMPSDGGIRFWIGGYSSDYSDVDLRDSEWHHIVLTANGVNWNWYIDGSSVKGTVNSYIPTNTNSQSVRFGSNTEGGELFSGIIDEVKIYNRAIGSSEAYHNYNNGDGNREPYSNQDLVGFWRFSEGSGTTVADSSGNNNDGVIY